MDIGDRIGFATLLVTIAGIFVAYDIHVRSERKKTKRELEEKDKMIEYLKAENSNKHEIIMTFAAKNEKDL